MNITHGGTQALDRASLRICGQQIRGQYVQLDVYDSLAYEFIRYNNDKTQWPTTTASEFTATANEILWHGSYDTDTNYIVAPKVSYQEIKGKRVKLSLEYAFVRADDSDIIDMPIALTFGNDSGDILGDDYCYIEESIFAEMTDTKYHFAEFTINVGYYEEDVPDDMKYFQLRISNNEENVVQIRNVSMTVIPMGSITGVATRGGLNYDSTSDMLRTLDLTMAVKDSTLIPDENGVIFLNRFVHVLVGIGDSEYLQRLESCTSSYTTFEEMNSQMAQHPVSGHYSVTRDETMNNAKTIWYYDVDTDIYTLDSAEILWLKKGYYILDSPNYSFSKDKSELTIGGLDLVAWLDGTRNGYLNGTLHRIEAGTNVKEAIESTVTELGGIYKTDVEECRTSATAEIQDVPNDIDTDGGYTIWEILTGLKEILPTYSMYFDDDGTFCYHQIALTVPDEELPDEDLDGNVIKVIACRAEMDGDGNFILYTYEGTADTTVNISGTLKIEATDQMRELFLQNLDGEISVVRRLLNLTTSSTTTSQSSTVVNEDGSNVRASDIYKSKNIYFKSEADGQYCALTRLKTVNDTKTEELEANVISEGVDVDYQSIKNVVEVWGAPLESTITPSSTSITIGATTYLNLSFTVSPIAGYMIGFVMPTITSAQKAQYKNVPITLRINGTSVTLLEGDTNKSVYVGDVDSDEFYVLYCESTNLYYLSGTLQPNYVAICNSPISKFNVGEIGEIRLTCADGEFETITSTELAKERACWELYKHTCEKDTLTLTTAPLYNINVGDVLQYKTKNDDDYSWYTVQKITYPFTLGDTQSITLEKFYDYSNVTKPKLAIDSNGDYAIDSTDNYVIAESETSGTERQLTDTWAHIQKAVKAVVKEPTKVYDTTQSAYTSATYTVSDATNYIDEAIFYFDSPMTINSITLKIWYHVGTSPTYRTITTVQPPTTVNSIKLLSPIHWYNHATSGLQRHSLISVLLNGNVNASLNGRPYYVPPSQSVVMYVESISVNVTGTSAASVKVWYKDGPQSP